MIRLTGFFAGLASLLLGGFLLVWSEQAELRGYVQTVTEPDTITFWTRVPALVPRLPALSEVRRVEEARAAPVPREATVVWSVKVPAAVSQGTQVGDLFVLCQVRFRPPLDRFDLSHTTFAVERTGITGSDRPASAFYLSCACLAGTPLILWATAAPFLAIFAAARRRRLSAASAPPRGR